LYESKKDFGRRRLEIVPPIYEKESMGVKVRNNGIMEY
jgi:hypothetical protein